MKKILLVIILSILVNTMYSQVGINTESPNTLMKLDVRNFIIEGKAIPKGIMIPRMTEVQRNTINVSNPTNANSIMIYNTTEDCYNYYSKLEKKWKNLCGKLGKAQFDFDCSAVVVLGTYVEKKELTPSNMLKFLVTVTKPGSYDITDTTTNGYYFSTSGTFLSSGTYTVYAEDGTYPGFDYYGTTDGTARTQFSAVRVSESKAFTNYTAVVGTLHVYNSALALNALAWGIKKAAVSGINPPLKQLRYYQYYDEVALLTDL